MASHPPVSSVMPTSESGAVQQMLPFVIYTEGKSAQVYKEGKSFRMQERESSAGCPLQVGKGVSRL